MVQGARQSLGPSSYIVDLAAVTGVFKLCMMDACVLFYSPVALNFLRIPFIVSAGLSLSFNPTKLISAF